MYELYAHAQDGPFMRRNHEWKLTLTETELREHVAAIIDHYGLDNIRFEDLPPRVFIRQRGEDGGYLFSFESV